MARFHHQKGDAPEHSVDVTPTAILGSSMKDLSAFLQIYDAAAKTIRAIPKNGSTRKMFWLLLCFVWCGVCGGENKEPRPEGRCILDGTISIQTGFRNAALTSSGIRDLL